MRNNISIGTNIKSLMIRCQDRIIKDYSSSNMIEFPTKMGSYFPWHVLYMIYTPNMYVNKHSKYMYSSFTRLVEFMVSWKINILYPVIHSGAEW